MQMILPGTFSKTRIVRVDHDGVMTPCEASDVRQRVPAEAAERTLENWQRQISTSTMGTCVIMAADPKFGGNGVPDDSVDEASADRPTLRDIF